MKRNVSERSYIDDDGEVMEIDDDWVRLATYTPARTAQEAISLRLPTTDLVTGPGGAVPVTTPPPKGR